MNRSALFASVAFLVAASATASAQADTYNDNARVIGVEAQYDNVRVPHQECRKEWVPEARGTGGRDFGGAVIGGVAGALLGNQVGRGHGREAATAVGAVVGAFAGDHLARGGRWEQPYEPAGREVTSCRTVSEVQSRLSGYRVEYEYRGQRFSTLMQDRPGAFVPVRVTVEAVGR